MGLVGIGGQCIQCVGLRVHTELGDQDEDRTECLDLNRWPGFINTMLIDNIGQTPGKYANRSGVIKVSGVAILGWIVLVNSGCLILPTWRYLGNRPWATMMFRSNLIQHRVRNYCS